MARTLGDRNAPPPPANWQPVRTLNAGGAQLGGEQTLPLNPGRLLPMEADMLGQVGYKPGEPLPPDIAARIERAQLEAAEFVADAQTPAFPFPPGTPPVRPAGEMDIADLPPEKQRELREYIASAGQAAGTLRGMRLDRMPPSVAAGIQSAVEQAPRPAPTRTAPPRPAAPPPAPAPTPAAAPVTPPAPDPVHAAVELCPYCGWDMATQRQVGAVSEEDKHAFLIALKGGQRFRKEYRLAGDIRVIFRSHLASEVHTLRQQIVADAAADLRADAVPGQTAYATDALLYSTALSLEYISIGETSVPPLGEITLPEGYQATAPHTKLKGFCDLLLDEVLTTESLRRIVVQTWTVFEALVRQLEARAHDPNFFRATGSPT